LEDKKKAIYDCAKALFATRGYKDTNVADITKAALVSVGTFYNYYPSKDQLFIEIFQAENAQMMQGLMAATDMREEPVALIKKLLAQNAQMMLAHPILRQWYSPEVYRRIEQLYNDANGIQSIEFVYGDFKRLVEAWQSQGKMRSDIDSEMIMAMFGAIIRTGFHKEEIGLKYFPALQDHLTDFVLKALTEVKTTPGGTDNHDRG
jgi:AcrR family transcriptional regulator